MEECALCRSDAATFAVEPHESGIPAELWDKMAGLCTEQDKQERPARVETYLSRFAASWSRFFRLPVLATSAAAAVVLMVVLLYPTIRTVQPVVGLSSVQWHVKLMGPGEMPPVPKAITPKRDRLAMVIFFKGFDKTLSQKRIDSLYRSLKPTAGMLSRFNVVSPLEFKQSMVENRIRILNRDVLLKALHEKLRVNRVVLLTILKHDTSFDIEAQLVDSTNLKTLRSLDVRSLSQAELATALKNTSRSVLQLR